MVAHYHLLGISNRKHSTFFRVTDSQDFDGRRVRTEIFFSNLKKTENKVNGLMVFCKMSSVEMINLILNSVFTWCGHLCGVEGVLLELGAIEKYVSHFY